MVFATDLDNTMIFSHRLVDVSKANVHCLEFYEERPITYMTLTSIQKLKTLMQKIYIVPVTTRSISQFNRVELWSTMEYAIVSNGGTILHYGVPLIEWEQYMQKVLANYNLQSVYNLFTSLPDLLLKPRIVDGKFIFTKSSNVIKCKTILQKKLDTKIWQISFQGNKIYAIPQGITKGIALQYLCENILYQHLPVIAAGDSNLDISMLDYSTYGIIPSDCKLSVLEKKEWIRAGVGINSADSILDYVFALSR